MHFMRTNPTRDEPTCVGTGVEVTGAILDAKAVTVFASVLRDRVVAVSLSKLNSPTAAPGTLSKPSPLPPLAIHLRRDSGPSVAAFKH